MTKKKTKITALRAVILFFLKNKKDATFLTRNIGIYYVLLWNIYHWNPAVFAPISDPSVRPSARLFVRHHLSGACFLYSWPWLKILDQRYRLYITAFWVNSLFGPDIFPFDPISLKLHPLITLWRECRDLKTHTQILG